MAAVYDKGDKGALVVLETSLADAESGAPLAVCRTTLFARGDGHCGAPRDGLPEPTPRPAGEPDATILLAVPANQALIYRLSGDLNPLHADPEVAGRAGFPSPILHGLSTYGMVCRALSRSFEDLDLTRLRRLQARFSAPVYPGEDLAFDLWRDGHWVDFEVRAVARGVVVLKGGRAAFAGDDPLSPSGTFQS